MEVLPPPPPPPCASCQVDFGADEFGISNMPLVKLFLFKIFSLSGEILIRPFIRLNVLAALCILQDNEVSRCCHPQALRAFTFCPGGRCWHPVGQTCLWDLGHGAQGWGSTKCADGEIEAWAAKESGMM